MEKKSIKINMPLLSYIAESIQEQGYKFSSNPPTSTVRDIIYTALMQKEVFPVANTNDHNYMLFEKIKVTREATNATAGFDYYVSNDNLYILGFTFSRLNAEGNNIGACDMEIAIEVPEENYLRSLETLQNTITSEIEFLKFKKEKVDINEYLLKSLVDLTKEPVGTLDYIKVTNAVRDSTENTEKIKKRQALVRKAERMS